MAFGDLSVEGLQRYERKIVDDLRTFAPGEPYSDAKLQAFALRLRGAGFFSSVSALPDLITLQKDPAAERVRVQVVVTELPRRRVVFGIGYSTDEGPRGQVGFEHRDLLGRNLQLESALVLSAKQQRAFANFRTPYDENGRFYGFGQRIEREDIENQVTLRSNTYAGIGKRDGAIESFTSLQYQIEQQRIDAADGLEERTSQHALVLGKSWNLRRLDSTVTPTEGYALSAQVSGARSGVLSDRSFLRFYTRATRFQPLPTATFKNGTLVALVELGYVAASSREDIPSENLFRAGGVQSIRGYGYQSLGVRRGDAVVGGRYLAVTSLEYQHRLTEQYAAAVFVDYGNAGDSRSDFDPVAGYGVGLRWRTPVGPINLDVAYGQAVSRYRVHFSIGYTF
jgi:translocation and assembly module TamA